MGESPVTTRAEVDSDVVDAISHLRAALDMTESALLAEESTENGGRLWRRMNLNAAALDIGRALAALRKDADRNG